MLEDVIHLLFSEPNIFRILQRWHLGDESENQDGDGEYQEKCLHDWTVGIELKLLGQNIFFLNVWVTYFLLNLDLKYRGN